MPLARISVLDVFTAIWFVNGSTCHRGVHAMPKAHNNAVSTSAMTMVAANVIHMRCIAVPDGLVVPVFCDVSDTVCTTATVGRYGVGWVSVFGGSTIPMRYCADSASIRSRKPPKRTVLAIVSSVRLRCSPAKRSTKARYRFSVCSEYVPNSPRR